MTEEKLAAKSRELGDEKIPRLLWKYFLPAFVGVIMNATYNIVDRIFIGQGVGSMALSGLSVVFPIMLIVMAFGMLIGMGAGVQVSINMGRKDFSRAEKVLGNGVFLMVVVGLLVTFLGFMIKGPMLRAFGATDETIRYAQDYLNIILIGVVFQMIGFGLNNIIRAEGNARIAMLSMLLSGGINLVLDPVFIFVFDLGVKGAAYATVIAMIALDVWVLLHFTSRRAVIRLRMPNIRPNWKIIGLIISIGMAPFFMQLGSSAVNALFMSQLIKHGGDLAVGAMGIIASVSQLLIMSMVAINMASQPIIGFNFGARNYSRVKETVKTGIIAATGIGLFGWLIVQLFPHFIVRLFNSDDPVLFDIADKGLRIFLLTLPLIGFQVIAANFFQSIGKAKMATFLSLLRQLIILVPALLILPDIFGLKGVWLCSPVADVTSAIITGSFLLWQVRKLGTEDPDKIAGGKPHPGPDDEATTRAVETFQIVTPE
ncbi:MAG: MATE family efflux transporter [Bacteroidetes bacterium GWF2_49_14]|nr:MAG: MATE family efflux transporter [Bacteroidetes bacterium GWF2_49_14]HBB91700.1 MATE family efflux transporter [Bacteroidales bacterium]